MNGLAKPRWTLPTEVVALLRRRWERGDLLANTLGNDVIFPLRIPIRGPSSSEISADFSARMWRHTRLRNCNIPMSLRGVIL
jgi:hypothetical protein